jgi:hypothetical protein
MEGQSFEIKSSGQWKKIEVTIFESDVAQLLAQWSLSSEAVAKESMETLSIPKKFQAMTLLAQQLLAYRVHEAGGYTDSEYAVVIDNVGSKLADLRKKLLS